MDDNTIEIRDDEINVKEIMQKIRENIRRRQTAGELPPDPDVRIASSSCASTGSKVEDSFQRDLSYINSNWDIHNNSYFISSHRPYVGKALVKGRQLVHGEVRRYVDPMIFRQTEFNASIVRIITRALQRCAELDQRQQELETAYSSFKQESVDARVKELFTQMDEDINAKAWLVHVLEDRVQKGLEQKSAPLASTAKDNTNYFLFEERFRGSREDIKQRQLAFLPCFEKCSRILDIGCGRGEFLEILKDRAIGGIGGDSDPDL